MEPIVHKYNMGPIEALGVAGAQAYSSLDSKLNRHVNDNNRHVTNAERNSWNNKVDKTPKYHSFRRRFLNSYKNVNRFNNVYNEEKEVKDNIEKDQQNQNNYETPKKQIRGKTLKEDEAKGICEKFKYVYKEISCKSGQNIKEVFDEIFEQYIKRFPGKKEEPKKVENNIEEDLKDVNPLEAGDKVDEIKAQIKKYRKRNKAK